MAGLPLCPRCFTCAHAPRLSHFTHRHTRTTNINITNNTTTHSPCVSLLTPLYTHAARTHSTLVMLGSVMAARLVNVGLFCQTQQAFIFSVTMGLAELRAKFREFWFWCLILLLFLRLMMLYLVISLSMYMNSKAKAFVEW
eukprot:scpid40581/ scgid23905/ 